MMQQPWNIMCAKTAGLGFEGLKKKLQNIIPLRDSFCTDALF